MTEKDEEFQVGRGRRLRAEEREELARRLAEEYGRGRSIRSLAEDVERSYGFVHRVLSEQGVAMRRRGGRRQPVN